MSITVLRRFTSYVLVPLVCLTSALSAQSHVVAPVDLQKQILAVASARQHNMQTVTSLLSSPQAQRALGSAHIDPAQVKTAVASLDDQELARLAVRAEKVQADLAAGRMSDRDLLWILIGIAALILIIVAVH